MFYYVLLKESFNEGFNENFHFLLFSRLTRCEFRALVLVLSHHFCKGLKFSRASSWNEAVESQDYDMVKDASLEGIHKTIENEFYTLNRVFNNARSDLRASIELTDENKVLKERSNALQNKGKSWKRMEPDNNLDLRKRRWSKKLQELYERGIVD